MCHRVQKSFSSRQPEVENIPLIHEEPSEQIFFGQKGFNTESPFYNSKQLINLDDDLFFRNHLCKNPSYSCNHFGTFKFIVIYIMKGLPSV